MRKVFGYLRHAMRPPSEVDRLKKSLGNQPRKKPGVASAFGWTIHYVDHLAMLSSLETLVEKGWNDFLPDHDAPVILDCGANIGISVMNYKRKYPGAKITAFEPDPMILPVLKNNLRTNHIDGVTIVEAAIWTRSGEMDLFLEGADGSKLVQHESVHTVKVKTVDLAEYLSSPVDLVKIDIEGAEYNVLSHIKDKLGLVRNLIVECHVNRDHVGEFGNLVKTLADAGFEISINSIGRWRDLVRKPAKPPDEFDQYFLVTATRKKS